MTTTSEDVVMTRGAADLLAACVAANVDNLASVTDSLIESHKRDARKMAQRYIDLYEGLERIPDMLRTVYIDELLAHGGVAISTAYRLIDESST